jgi:hypothetical protein
MAAVNSGDGSPGATVCGDDHKRHRGAPGRLHDDEEAPKAGEQRWWRRAWVRDPAACGVGKGGGYGSGGEFQGCNTAYKGRVDRLGMRAKATRRARAAAGRTRGRVRPGYA